ncbi:MAG TPA: hypothetical protein VLA01_01340 [Nitrosopumilaceae archaeon]|nr:hypothetical protein [Nitrosopumilaceae archaeon]
MRDEQRFEIERAFDLLPHVVGASWAVIWFRLNGIKNPSREEFYEKVLEYFDLLNPLFDSFHSTSTLEDMNKYIKLRKNQEIKNIKEGKNKEIEKRYERYIDYG